MTGSSPGGRDGVDYDVKRCAKCAALIPSSATMCSYCNTTNPDAPLARPKGSVLSLRHGLRVTNVLIGANCAYLLFAVFAESARMQGKGNALQWILSATGFDAGLLMAGAYYHPLVVDGQWWRILSATFLHAGIIHIGVNMYSLRNIGYLAEDLFGPAKFLTVYLCSGAASTLAISVYYVWVLKRPGEMAPMLVGASGSVFGVAGLLTTYLLRAGTPRAREIGKSLGWNVLLMLGLGYVVPRISNTGHVGGLVCGALFGLMLRDSFTSRINARSASAWSRVALLCVVVTAVALAYAAWFALTYKGEI